MKHFFSQPGNIVALTGIISILIIFITLVIKDCKSFNRIKQLLRQENIEYNNSKRIIVEYDYELTKQDQWSNMVQQWEEIAHGVFKYPKYICFVRYKDDTTEILKNVHSMAYQSIRNGIIDGRYKCKEYKEIQLIKPKPQFQPTY